jgi:hypothetical protein
MEDLLGFIFEFAVEVVLQIVFEAGIDAASRACRPKEEVPARSRADRPFRIVALLRLMLGRADPPSTILKFTLLGLGSGFLSVLLFPHPLVPPSRFHGLSLLISPVVTGLVMGFVGRMTRRRGETPVRIESFAYGFTFAFAFALIRILMVH